jgi:hypothetical protein
MRREPPNPKTVRLDTDQEIALSATEVHTATSETSVPRVNMNLEVQIIPVSDVDRSKRFYEQLGWRLDDDVAPLDGLRIVQFTPPVRGPRSPSARDSQPPRQARPRAGSSSPTSRRPTTNSSAVAST